jgi:hypothetical protein
LPRGVSLISVLFGSVFLIGFSVAAFFLGFNRLYVYGLLIGVSPLAGEWLWTKGYAAHHGIPVTFGTASGIMILIGSVLFINFLRGTPVPKEGIPSEET